MNRSISLSGFAPACFTLMELLLRFEAEMTRIFILEGFESTRRNLEAVSCIWD